MNTTNSGDILTLSQSVSLPNGLSLYQAIDNSQAGPVIIRNSSFSSSRARPLLLKSGSSVLVENNLIYDSAAACELGAETGWGEGPRPMNITVRNNTFRDMDMEALFVGVAGAVANNLATNVVITGNVFEDCGQETIGGSPTSNYGNPLWVQNATAPVINNNVFIRNWDANIVSENNTSVQITGNTFYSPNQIQPTLPYPVSPNTVIWADNTQGLALSGNLVSDLGPYCSQFVTMTPSVTGASGIANGIISTDTPYTFVLPSDGMVIDDAGAGGAGTQLIQYYANGALNQQWSLNPESSVPGWFTLTSLKNGLYAAVNSTAAGSAILLQDQTLANGIPASNQLWQLVPVDSQTVNIVNRSGGYCINVYGASTSPGAQLCQWYSGRARNQDWTLNAVLPAGWMDTDLGEPGISGIATYNAGAWTIAGSGADIWNNSDAFHFARQTAYADGVMIAEVTGITKTDPWAKAGVMFRNNTDPSSMFVDVVATAGNGVTLQWRGQYGGSCGYVQVSGVAAPSASNPVWLKLAKRGDAFTGSYSKDGTAWTEIGTAAAAFDNRVYLSGLAVTAHNNADLNTATVENVSRALVSLHSGEWLQQGQYLSSPDGQNILVQQSDGNLVLYRGSDPQHEGTPLWASGYNQPTPGQYFTFLQPDGNLVTYEGTPYDDGAAVWASGTYGAGVTDLVISNAPNFQLVNGSAVIKQYP